VENVVRQSVIRQVWRVVGYTIALVLFLAVVLAGFTQSKLFKERLRLFIISTIASNTDAAVNLGTIRGNFVTGFSIDSASIRVDGAELLSTGEIRIVYDILSLPRRRLRINKLTIEHPRVTLHRAANDSLWNVEKFLRRQQEPLRDARTPSAFDWAIRIDELSLVNGTAVVLDSLSLTSPEHLPALPHQVEYHNIAVHSLNLVCSGAFDGRQADLKVEQLSCDLLQPKFAVRRFKGEFSLSPSGIDATSLVIETEDSRINLSASLKEVNLLDGIELDQLKDKPVKLNLLADDISLNELKRFIAAIDFLDGSAHVDVDLQGVFGHLIINRLNLRTHSTSLALSGTLRNLHRPEDLYIDVNIDNSVMVANDVNKLLPAFHLPRFDHVGKFNLNARYTGTPLNFSSAVRIDGEVGWIEARTSLNLERKPMQYDCSFQTRNLDVSKLWPSSPVQSLVTSRGTIKGFGTSIEDIGTNVAVVFDSTLVQNMLLTESSIDIRLRRQSITAHVRLNSLDTQISLSGTADYTHTPQFHIEGEVVKLNLAHLLNERRYGSSLSFRTVADISGTHIDSLSGTLSASFSSSSFQTYEFEGQELKMEIRRHNGDSTVISIQSPITDATLTGQYSLTSLVEFLTGEYEAVSEAVAERMASLRASSQQMKDTRQGRRVTVTRSAERVPFNAEFSLNVKNLRPLSIFLGGTPFDGRGTVNGTAVLNNSEFSLECTTHIAQIFVGTVDKGFFVEKSDASVFFGSAQLNGAADYLDHLRLHAHLNAKHGIINNHTLDRVNLSIQYQNDSARYTFVSTFDSISTIAVQGHAHPAADGYSVGIDSTTIAFGDLSWINDSMLVVHIGDSGLTVKEFDLEKTGDHRERISLRGTLAYNGAIEGVLHVQRFNLRNFGHYVKLKDLLLERGFTGTFDLKAEIGGTVAAPTLMLTARGETITYRGKTVGTFIGVFDYRDRALTVDLGIGNLKPDETRPSDLVVQGTIPIDLALTGTQQRFPNKPIDLTISSDGFAIDVLDPVLTTLDDVRGKLFCNVRVAGTPQNPQYNGTIIFSDFQFTFVPNNVLYYVSATMKAAGDRIQLVDVQIRNDTKDRSDGVVTVGGYFSIRNFEVDSFDLTARGQLLLMKETTRRSRTMYGTLVAATGINGLHYSGSFERSYLSGEVYIREASLVFPPTRETTYDPRETPVTYIVVDDTSKHDTFAESLSEQFFAEPTNGNLESSARPSTRTIWDGMSYDVAIETRGTAEIRMIFNQSTNEELFAALDGRVVLQRGERGPRINGEISVGERSYYNFFKKFSARGSLKFVGLPDNPELNITASYEGVRLIDTAVTQQKKPEERVVVTLDITGTRYEPKIAMSMTVDGEARTGDVESDAIPFILTGKFLDDLSSQEKSDIATSLGSIASGSLLYGLPSQMLSGMLSDFLQKEFPIIRRAEFTYVGGNLQESADLRLSGEIGKAYWRAGGRIFTNIGNANVSVQLSMGEVFESVALRNLFLELERKVETGEGEEQKKLTNAARIFFRISF